MSCLNAAVLLTEEYVCHGGATLETVLCVYVEVPALRAL